MKAHHWAPSIFWILIGIYVVIHAYHLGLGRFRHPGPGFIFFLAAWLLIILGVVDLAGTLVGKSEKDKEGKSLWSDIRWPKILLVLIVLSSYAYFLSILGFFLSTFLVMVFLFKAVEPMKWWMAIMGSCITTGVAIGIFELLLDVPFPKSFLGF